MTGNRPLDSENSTKTNEVPFYSEHGGMWVNGARMTRMTWPFAKMELYSWGFRLTGAKFTPESVIELKRRRGLISAGIEIVHSNANAPKAIVYWTFNLSRLEAELGKIGFRVTGD